MLNMPSFKHYFLLKIMIPGDNVLQGYCREEKYLLPSTLITSVLKQL